MSKQRWFASGITKSAPERVDTENGIIYGAAVVTVGEAKGHGVSLDRSFVDDVVSFGGEKKNGIKARFGHPNMCSTALGTFIGRVKNFRSDGDIARADLFLSNEAKETPQGNLHDYVLGLAKNEPDIFGLSIVFTPGKEYQTNSDGEKVYSGDDDFVAGGKKFTELASLHACDVVDDPAANPDGLFSAWSFETFAGQATEFLDMHPEIFDALKQHPEIMKEFVERYSVDTDCINGNGSEEPLLEIEKKEKKMSDENVKTEDEIREDVQAVELERFEALKAAFPNDLDFAMKHYAEKSSVDKAKAEYSVVLVEKLAAANKEVEELKSKLESANKKQVAIVPESDESEGGAPVGFEAESGGKSFDAHIKEQIETGMSRGEAIQFCVKNHPEAYAVSQKGSK